MKIVIAGDFCVEDRVGKELRLHNYENLLSQIKPIIEQADYAIVNIECPIVEHNAQPISKCGPNLRGIYEIADVLQWAGFRCFTIANNHIMDYGETGMIDTLMCLNDRQIDYVGGGCSISQASEVLYKRIEGQILAVINCCEHEFSIATEDSAGANPLNPIQQYYKIQEARKNADYILIIVHGGYEHYQLPSLRMKETYRFFIDAGADAVVNHHQHCYSGYEVYKGKPIFYGIGNFLFDSPHYRNSMWNEGYLVVLDFDGRMPEFEMYPYVQCNESASVIPMMGDKREAFFRDINRLNEIIADDVNLQREFERRVDKISRNYTYIFQPMRGRIMSSLFSRGLISSMVGKKVKQKIINYISCESHRDSLLSSLKNL